MSTQLPTFTEDVSIHQSLADQPSLTSTELKQAWDSPANKIKTYINNTLIPSLETLIDDLDASSIIYDDTSTELNATTVQGAIGKLKDLIDGLSFTASNISYDNSSSGMSATNVQNAVNELKTGLNTVSSSASTKLNYGDLVVTQHSSGTIDNGHGGSVAKIISVSKTGYYPMGIVGFTSSSINHYNNTEMGACLRDLYLSERANGSCKIYGVTHVANNEAWTYTSQFMAFVLWAKIS